MQGSRFDGLTRELAAGRSRRSVVKGLAAGLVAGAAGLAAERGARADHEQGHGRDHCAKEGQQAQPHKTCCPGLAPDAGGRCRPVVGCPNAVLAGPYYDPAASFPEDNAFLVDDDLQVLVNGVPVFTDNDETADFIQSIALGPLANGAQLQVVASNSTLPQFCTFGFEHLDPLTLYCPSTGTSQVINPTTISQPAGGCGNVFYDQTFTVAL